MTHYTYRNILACLRNIVQSLLALGTMGTPLSNLARQGFIHVEVTNRRNILCAKDTMHCSF
jgi:hypothetical protein